MDFDCSYEFGYILGVDVGVGIGNRGYFLVFPFIVWYEVEEQDQHLFER